MSRSPRRRVLDEIARQAKLNPAYGQDASLDDRITLQVQNIPAAAAFERALEGTKMTATIRPNGDVMFLADDSVRAASGRITGVVTDATTQLPLRGVAVTVDAATQGVLTNNDGRFHIDGISAAAHRITIRRVGYVRQVKTVNVSDDQVTDLRVALSPSTNTLDQVVVTGTVIPTAMKAVPSAMTVITAKQIEERGITHIDQLFRGDIPGMFAPSTGSGNGDDAVIVYSRGANRVSGSISGGAGGVAGLPDVSSMVTDGTTTPMRTYVDGIEMSRPEYLSQIDPRSIERIEILTGPQASTIYGSNAINGVMQIFTKRGTTQRPQLTVDLQTGLIQNNFSTALSPTHNEAAQLSGADGRWSYNAGGAWDYTGKWTPGAQKTRTSVYGGLRTLAGPLTIDLTARQSWLANKQITTAIAQGASDLLQHGVYTSNAAALNGGLDQVAMVNVGTHTLGATFMYRPISWWTHEVTVGTDRTDNSNLGRTFRHGSPRDTTLPFNMSTTNQSSFRYNSTAQLPMTGFATLTLTGGVDSWRTASVSQGGNVVAGTGYLPDVYTIRDAPSHNTGGFLQGQLGLADALFLTYGLRAEWNPNYGPNAQPNLAPRFGAAYTANLGSITAKIRGSYGRSTRPPTDGQRSAVHMTDPNIVAIFGTLDDQLASPELGAEFQQGGEGGLELYWGAHASLIVTRYNQTVDGLIERVNNVDSVRSQLLATAYGAYGWDPNYAHPDGYFYWGQAQYINIGSIRNQGWELHGTGTLGMLSADGTYSWTKSRVIGVTERYRKLFVRDAYQPGRAFELVPEHTWAATFTYRTRGSRLSLTMNGVAQIYTGADALALAVGGLPYSWNYRVSTARTRMSLPSYYRSVNAGYVTTDLNAARSLTSLVELTMQVQNLSNAYHNDYSAVYASMGRLSKLGLRWRL